MNSLLAAAAALTTTVLIASGCASTDAGPSTASGSELVYRTGSNIPKREKTTTAKEEQEKKTAESPAAQTTGAGSPRTN
jgi:hypothetical protein